MVDNQEFLRVLFGEDAPWVHVTSFQDDPADITDKRRFICWAGDYASRINLIPDSNQYFTISTFFCDEKQKARRRKALFRQTHVIVADDVREKLPEENVLKLPPPTYKLETSPGSEQWGWVLDTPCTDRAMVENLLDGLVAQGLAPEGKDPGMKGVTRYVRLPEGVNTKASRVAASGGYAPRCRILEWHPERKTSIHDLAGPFFVDLRAERRETRIDGAADLPDHPLLDLADIIHIKDIRSDGRFDITCPWVNEHTGAADDGAAIFTNKDGSIGFKCHHGSCQERTGKHLLDRIEVDYPDFRGQLTKFKILRDFDMSGITTTAPPPPEQTEDFDNLRFDTPTQEPEFQYNFYTSEPVGGTPQTAPAPPVSEADVYQLLMNELVRHPPTSPQAIEIAMKLLQAVDSIPHISRLVWHNKIKDHMLWTNPDMKVILEQGRAQWYVKTDKDQSVYDQFTYVIGIGQFLNIAKNQFMKPEVFQNGFCHIDENIRSEALINNRCKKVDAIDYAPGFPPYFTEKGINYVNTWYDSTDPGIPGDPSPWLNHFDALGWIGDDKEHIIKFLAHTIQNPDDKINHAIILGGGEGIGKDTILYPAMQALGRNARTIHSRALTTDYNDYLLNTKLLHINEIDAGNYVQAAQISNRVKDFITAPPDRLSINQKMIPLFDVRNIVNVIMGTNDTLPLKMSGDTRRYFVLWSDLNIRDAAGQVRADWLKYFKDLWYWMREGQGWRVVTHYLANYDLSGFDSKQSPKVTEALKDIQEASEDPIVSIFKECVHQYTSLFKSDLLSINDIHQVMRSLDVSGMGFNLKNLPSVNILGKIIKQSALCHIYRVYKNKNDMKVYCVRNNGKYAHMHKKDIFKEYEQQLAMARAQFTIAAVENKDNELTS
jgi:hypothetical protein